MKNNQFGKNLPLVISSQTFENLFLKELCCNLNLGLATKARACKGAGQEWARESKEWERMNLHIPKWAPIFRVGVLMNFQNFQSNYKGQIDSLTPNH
jgi:hypothetical protein